MSRHRAEPAEGVPFSPEVAIRAYLPLMHELAIRIELVAAACDGNLNLTPPYAREYAYLQFRRMCELIALGCLLLHGDLKIARGQGVKKEWSAEKIMKMLHAEHPHAFPQSMVMERDAATKQVTMRANSKPEALTLQGFQKLYAKCGEVLHRGTIRSLAASPQISETDYQQTVDWQRMVVDLMNNHVVTRASGAGMYFTSLRTETGFPQCSLITVTPGDGLTVQTTKLHIPTPGV